MWQVHRGGLTQVDSQEAWIFWSPFFLQSLDARRIHLQCCLYISLRVVGISQSKEAAHTQSQNESNAPALEAILHQDTPTTTTTTTHTPVEKQNKTKKKKKKKKKKQQERQTGKKDRQIRQQGGVVQAQGFVRSQSGHQDGDTVLGGVIIVEFQSGSVQDFGVRLLIQVQDTRLL